MTELYRTKYKRFDHPAGTIVTIFTGYDYGIASDDTRGTMIEHISVQKIEEAEKFFTIRKDGIEPYVETMPDIDPETPEPPEQFINGKKVRRYDAVLPTSEIIVGQKARLITGDILFTTSLVVAMDAATGMVETMNTVYVKN